MRLTLKIENAQLSWEESSTQRAPVRLYIKRARAEVIAGSATQVALSIREKTAPLYTNDIPIEYQLGTSPLDSREDIYVELRPYPRTNSMTGTLYLAVKTNTADPTNIVLIYLDVEPAP